MSVWIFPLAQQRRCVQLRPTGKSRGDARLPGFTASARRPAPACPEGAPLSSAGSSFHVGTFGPGLFRGNHCWGPSGEHFGRVGSVLPLLLPRKGGHKCFKCPK